jgi:spectinomycin phosphotransferase
MLEKPAIPDEQILSWLRDEFDLCPAEFTFLPLGADLNTAVYRAVTRAGVAYFVKLRLADFDEIAVTLPKFLHDSGVDPIIPPIVSKNGRLWVSVGAVSLILYPFIAGRNGYEIKLTERQWLDIGSALRRIHATSLPPDLLRRIPPDTYTSQWRESVSASLRLLGDTFPDPTAHKLVEFLTAKRLEIENLVEKAARLAQDLQARSPRPALCHSDLHAGNILIAPDGETYIVDWDNPILAFKERDLMFVGGGQGFIGRTAQEEETLFYRGYGPTQIDPSALAYYRCERIVQDIAIYCQQLLLTTEGGDDREQSLHYLMSNFLPNGTIEIAVRSDQTRKGGSPS